MPSFLVAFHRPPNALTPEQTDRLMAQGRVWLDGLGEAVTSALTPLGKSIWVVNETDSDSAESTGLAGFMVIQAEDTSAAVEIARHSPHLTVGGEIEIAPILDLDFKPV